MRFSPRRFRRVATNLSLAVYSLSNEAAMKYRITEPTFFLHKDRKPGDTLEAPVGPFRYEPTGGGLKRTAQFEEINERTAKLNKFSELASRAGAIRKSLDDRADKLAHRLDAIPALADAAFTKHETALDETEQGIKALEDSLRDLAGHNGTPLPDSSEG